MYQFVILRSSFSFRVPPCDYILPHLPAYVKHFFENFFQKVFKKSIDSGSQLCYNTDAPEGGTGESAGPG